MARNKRWASSGLDFKINIDPVMDAIAAGYVLTDFKKNRKYVDTIVDIAFEQADDEFKRQTDAYAMATGELRHMYEWGTIGINRGRTNVRQQPNAPNAKLWHTFTTGEGLDRMLAFVYKPSVANVPKPTVGQTGMASDVIASLRDHVFTWKAEVIEKAQMVTIRPRQAKFLLIPAYEENRPYMRPYDIKRGYMLTKGPIKARPGLYSEAFTEYWVTYWQTRGRTILETSVQSQMLSDFQPEFRPKRGGKPLPIGTFSVRSAIAKKETETRKRIEAKARLREAREAVDDD